MEIQTERRHTQSCSPTSWWRRNLRWRRSGKSPFGHVISAWSIVSVAAFMGVLLGPFVWDYYQTRVWEREVEPTLASIVTRLESELEALPACTIHEGVTICDRGDELAPQTLWQLRSDAIERLLREVFQARSIVESEHRDEVGRIDFLVERDLEIILWILQRDLPDAVVQRDDQAFRSGIDSMKSHVSRLSGNAREYGFDVPAIDWTPADPIFDGD